MRLLKISLDFGTWLLTAANQGWKNNIIQGLGMKSLILFYGGFLFFKYMILKCENFPAFSNTIFFLKELASPKAPFSKKQPQQPILDKFLINSKHIYL